MNSNTKILATMGPTLESCDDVFKMIQLGVTDFRIHMGQRTRDFCTYFYNAVLASNQAKEEIDILLDLPSTRPRVVNMNEHLFSKDEFAYIVDSASDTDMNEHYVNIPLFKFNDILNFIKVGEHISFRDGHVVFEVKSKVQNGILVKCTKSNLIIKSGASICCPESEIIYQPLDEIDISYLEKMKNMGLCPNKIAISFASNIKQINIVKNCIYKIWPDNNIKIICKIEDRLGLKNIDELIDSSDGIMVARGDLLLCINPYEMPKIQLDLANRYRNAGKILIIATEFFENFAESGIVNRSELSDVALAVREGANYIMLSRETGNSQFNFECVELINSIIQNEFNK